MVRWGYLHISTVILTFCICISAIGFVSITQEFAEEKKDATGTADFYMKGVPNEGVAD